MYDINRDLDRLSKSKFRSSFHLRNYMIDYIDINGLELVRKHSKELIKKKIGDANPVNDGKQTPMKNHPVFIGMHATGSCCRSCLYKWHGIPKGRVLYDDEIDYLSDLVMEWIKKEYIK